MTLTERAAGILLHISSLPSPFGIGTFGKAAYEWIDFLANAAQRYWQILPLGPTGTSNSPYQSPSAFAGNPYFIDLELLCEAGLLSAQECATRDWGEDPRFVNFARVREHREPLLRTAYSRFSDMEALHAFQEQNAWWLTDYTLFMAIQAKMGGKPWTQWDEPLRLRTPGALEACMLSCAEDMGYHAFVQYLFLQQWGALKRHANARGVKIIGDIPIYVALNSADVWANSSLFMLDENHMPTEISGVPPDYFSPTGQLWNNPLYRWDVHKATGYRWWLNRLRMNFTLCDALRIDHFRGLESYYAIPYGDATAERGVWKPGPGMDFIDAIEAEFPSPPIIAEDLGVLTEGVRDLLATSAYPGMKVLQFAFDHKEENDHMPHKYTRNSVVYTGTHDNDTLLGWLDSATKEDVALACAYLNTGEAPAEILWSFIRRAYSSVANIAIIPMQDFLELDGAARMNTPSTEGGTNWCWRMERGAAGADLAAHIARLATLYGRRAQEKTKKTPGKHQAKHD